MHYISVSTILRNMLLLTMVQDLLMKETLPRSIERWQSFCNTAQLGEIP